MTCDATRSLLTDYIKDELTRPESDNVASHLTICEACRTQEAEIRKNFGLLRLAAGRTPAPAPAVWDRINDAVDDLEAAPARVSAWVWRTFAAAAALLIAASAFSLFGPGSPASPAPVARLERVGDGVAVYRASGGAREAMKPGASLSTGETLALDPGAAAVFAIEGVGRFRVAGGTTLRMADSRTIELQSGEVIADIRPNARGFRIVGPQARAVVLGTLFRVCAAEGRTALTVARGAVTFANGEGSVEVRAGYQSTAGAGTAPAAPLELAADAADWDLFASLAPAPRVKLELGAAAPGKPVPFTLILTSDAPTLVESVVSERTYVILTLEDPAGARRLVRLSAADLTASWDLPPRNGLVSIDRQNRLVLKGRLPAPDVAGSWTASALFASGGREESWAGYAESAAEKLEVQR